MARNSRAEAPSERVSVRLSPAERDLMETAASLSRQTPSDFVREALRRHRLLIESHAPPLRNRPTK